MANTTPLIGTGLSNTNVLQLEAGNDGISHAVALPGGDYVGVNSFSINRYRADGTLDPAFGKQGTVRLFDTHMEIDSRLEFSA